MRYLRQSTATAILIGSFIDDTDGKTPETALTVASIDVDLYKQSDTHPLTKTDITPAASGSSNDMAHVANGWYSLELTTSNTDTVGRCVITANISGALPVWHEFMVLPTLIYDSLIGGSDKLQVHVDEITNNLITAAAIATGAIDADAIADNAIDAGAIADGAIDAATFAAGAINAAAIATDAIDADAIADGAITPGVFAANAITNAAVADDVVVGSVAGAVGSVTGNVGGNVIGSVGSLGAQAQLDVNAEADAALADYDPPTFAELDSRTDAIDVALTLIASYLDTEVAAILTRLGLPVGASFSADIAAVQSDTNDIQNRLPAALASGRMPADVTAINGVAAAAAQLARSAATIVNGASITGTLSTTQMSTDLIEATDSHYNGRIIIWTSGVLLNQATNITAYNGTTKTLTYTATTEAPANGDTFIIV